MNGWNSVATLCLVCAKSFRNAKNFIMHIEMTDRLEIFVYILICCMCDGIFCIMSAIFVYTDEYILYFMHFLRRWTFFAHTIIVYNKISSIYIWAYILVCNKTRLFLIAGQCTLAYTYIQPSRAGKQILPTYKYSFIYISLSKYYYCIILYYYLSLLDYICMRMRFFESHYILRHFSLLDVGSRCFFRKSSIYSMFFK